VLLKYMYMHEYVCTESVQNNRDPSPCDLHYKIDPNINGKKKMCLHFQMDPHTPFLSLTHTHTQRNLEMARNGPPYAQLREVKNPKFPKYAGKISKVTDIHVEIDLRRKLRMRLIFGT